MCSCISALHKGLSLEGAAEMPLGSALDFGQLCDWMQIKICKASESDEEATYNTAS